MTIPQHHGLPALIIPKKTDHNSAALIDAVHEAIAEYQSMYPRVKTVHLAVADVVLIDYLQELRRLNEVAVDAWLEEYLSPVAARRSAFENPLM